MKRLIIIVEGDTELAFVNTILAPYLYSKGILSVSCFKIKHSKGGLSKYEHLKNPQKSGSGPLHPRSFFLRK